jgi:hypothetical protein
MMNGKGFCPILSTISGNKTCIKEECEWWIPEKFIPFYAISPPGSVPVLNPEKSRTVPGHCGVVRP